MNEVMKRLYKAASEIKNVNGQSAVAKMLNASPQTVKNWETRGVSKKGIIDAAKVLNISAVWLETGQGNMTEARPIEPNATIIGTVDAWDGNTPLGSDDVEVPFYKDIGLAAGAGNFEDMDYNGYKLRFSKSTLRRHGINPADVVCVSADGNSMEPVFPDGATLGINTADKTIKDGKIYAINHGGLLRTKILQRLPDNKIRIKSYNASEWPDEEVDASEIVVIGRVFWWSVMA